MSDGKAHQPDEYVEIAKKFLADCPKPLSAMAERVLFIKEGLFVHPIKRPSVCLSKECH
jgi:hypothetical protein